MRLGAIALLVVEVVGIVFLLYKSSKVHGEIQQHEKDW